jgi:predicted PurR-regulated permease PerM
MTVSGGEVRPSVTPTVDGEDSASEVAVPEIVEEGLPAAPGVANVFLGGLLLLASLAACYLAAAILLPIVVAFVLMLVLQPAMRVLQRLHVPRLIAAIFIILVFFGALVGIGMMLSGPAASWAQKLPSGIPKLQERLSFLREPISAFQQLMSRAESLTQMTPQSGPLPVTLAGAGLSERLLDSTRAVVSGLLEIVLVLFFLLMAGDTFRDGWSRFCPVSRTSGRRSRSRSRSKATSQPI